MEPAVMRDRERGTSLIEVLVASALLMTLMAGLMSLAGLAISTTENQGHLAARTTEYAQDKMEQLVSLAWNDASTDTRVFPATSGGTGLAVGGSYNIDSPAAGYVDYLDEDGNLCGTASVKCPTAPSGTTAPTGWFYKRVWKVELVSGSTTLKQITVAAGTSRGFGGATRSVSYLTVLKTNPF
jgi:hypothetical protein